MKQTYLQRMMTLALLAVVIVTIAAPQPAYAQEATEATIGVASRSDNTTLWGLFRMGGWSMYVLLIGSVAAVGLTIYNGIALQTKKFLRPDIYEKLKGLMEADDFNGARDYCEHEKSPLANIVHAGLDRVAGSYLDIESVEKGMEEAAMEEVTGNLTPINYLSVIAVISPMVGLLGTVSGMIKAFGNMATQGMGKPEMLADNISEALITTASGLIVGIPVMIIYFYFKNRYTGLISALNRMSGEVLEKMKQSANRLHEGFQGE
jgi:biopolymer transport protein ExbB